MARRRAVEQATEGQNHPCPHCPSAFRTLRGLRSHVGQKHRAEARAAAGDVGPPAAGGPADLAEFLKGAWDTGGAPSKLTPRRQKLILDLVRAGCYASVAARAVGVDVSTFRRWRSKGQAEALLPKAKRGPYHAFYAALVGAEAQGEASLVAQLRILAKSNPRALVEMLRRRYSTRWDLGTRSTRFKGEAGGMSLDVVRELLDPEEQADLDDMLEELDE